MWFAAAVAVIGAGCNNDDEWFEIYDVRAGDGIVEVDMQHDMTREGISGSELVFRVCAIPGSSCSLVEPREDVFSIPASTRSTMTFEWSTPGDFTVRAGLRDIGSPFWDEALTGSTNFSYPDPAAGGEDAAPEVTTPAEDDADVEAPETSDVDETTTTVDETTTTAVAEGGTTTAPPTTVRTATTSPSAGTTTTVALNPAGGAAATTTTTTTTTTSTTTSTTTTTMPDYNTTTTTQPVSGIGEWIRNDMTTCAYRGTMGCGIYRTQYEYFPDYGPVGGPGDMMPSTWGPVGQIAYSLYTGCEPACGWYYSSTPGTYEWGPAVPASP